LKKGDLFKVGDTEWNVEKLREVVYKAQKTGETEQHMCGQQKDEYEWKALGLVDLGCQRVYAVKVILFNKSKASAALAYWPVPLYGSTDEEHVVQLAIEKEQIPEVEYVTPENIPQDDDLDDKKAEINPVSSTTSGSVGIVTNDANLLPTLNENMKRMVDALEKLDSLDKNVKRIADTLDKLLLVVQTTKKI